MEHEMYLLSLCLPIALGRWSSLDLDAEVKQSMRWQGPGFGWSGWKGTSKSQRIHPGFGWSGWKRTSKSQRIQQSWPAWLRGTKLSWFSYQLAWFFTQLLNVRALPKALSSPNPLPVWSLLLPWLSISPKTLPTISKAKSVVQVQWEHLLECLRDISN